MISIVVPTLNEEKNLRALLPAALAAAPEVVVSDGGSTDRTVAVARQLGARVITGPPGRGGQLNRGARAARGEILLFLHADTTLHPGALEQVQAAIAAGAEGGAFTLRFDVDRPLFRFGAAVINLRTRWLKAPLGDQAHFVTRPVFDEMSGYAEWPILEDLDFARRLRSRGRMVILAGPVTTAGRRFLAQGPLRTVLNNWWIWGLYRMGVSPHRLARRYRPAGFSRWDEKQEGPGVAPAAPESPGPRSPSGTTRETPPAS